MDKNDAICTMTFLLRNSLMEFCGKRVEDCVEPIVEKVSKEIQSPSFQAAFAAALRKDVHQPKIPQPTAAFPIVELYMVDAANPKLFIDGSGDRTTDRRKSCGFDLNAPEHLIPPAGITWRYVRLKKPTP